MTCRAWHIEGGRATPIDPLAAVDATGGFTWIHLHGEGEVVAKWLRDHAHLPDYVIDPLTAVETRPRCDAIGKGAFVNLRGLSDDVLSSADPLASVRLYASAGRVHSVTRRKLTAFHTVVDRVERGEVADPGDLIVAFASAITEQLDPLIADLGDTLDECEEALDPTRIFEQRRAVTHTRVRAIGYRRFLVPQRSALEKLGQLPGDWLQADDRLHLAAAADRAARMAEEVDSIRERAALVHETLTDLRAEQLDQRSLQIAIVAMVFLPLTFLTGLLGMNVKGIPFADEPWAFAGVVGLCVAMSAGIVAWFVRKHWIGR
ncbi:MULTISPECIES: zinc transporter ZntB [Sphingomonas]|jgi:zinc transporter|uniref:Magnesium transporter CorA n=1 Tax=Sphingomonas hankookensis TaxID=563996 RepID=A0ABR5Y8Y5_9SPHN|nr:MULTISPECIES: zinc transporter ZntB [Sphingomonas]KZE08711.1 magnesium transporter CorA [Sphingomonas hankookensis]PZT95750.1 MAG: zinc transporter ZntB [Sphingomonas sp.]RSV32208.1 zinc transporter ZntB [Sphingomonas sp. ABOLH]WCP72957.1 zinc transporter ZntB [Sphingomonas hankookensis]